MPDEETTVLLIVPGIVFAEDHMAHMGVPYKSAERNYAEGNMGFCDLRDRPDLVDDIMEAQRSTGLAEFLKAINQVGSPIMSLGCECGWFKSESYTSSYVDITFREKPIKDERDALFDLMTTLISNLDVSENALDVNFEISTSPLRTFFDQTDRLCLNVRFIARGEGEEVGWKNFSKLMSEFATILNKWVAGDQETMAWTELRKYEQS